MAHPKPLMDVLIGGAGWIWSGAGRMDAITFTFDPRPASHQVHCQLLGHFRLRQHFPGFSVNDEEPSVDFSSGRLHFLQSSFILWPPSVQVSPSELQLRSFEFMEQQ